MSDSGSSISIEDVSAYLLNTRWFPDLLTPPACPARSGPISERLIRAVAVLARPRSGPTWQIQAAFVFGTRAPSRPPERGGPRGSVPVGLLYRDSACIIGTRPSGHFPSGLCSSPGHCSSPGSASGRTVRPHQELQPPRRARDQLEPY